LRVEGRRLGFEGRSETVLASAARVRAELLYDGVEPAEGIL
jgi:hypothetical protein